MNQALFNYYIIDRAHHALRHPATTIPSAEEYAREGLSPRERMADRFARACHAEVPHIAEGEKIVFIYEGNKWWEGTKDDILLSDNPELNDFVFASAMAKRAKSVSR